jgi:hypothetical protein
MFGRGFELFRLLGFSVKVDASSRASRLMVVDGDRLVGVLALKDLLGFFSLRLELGDPAKA